MDASVGRWEVTMVESSRWDATDVRVDGSEKPCGTWWRRTASYMLGIILPWALVSQAISMMATGRSLLEGGAAWLIYCAAFVVVVAVSAVLTRNGQSPTQRLFKLQVCELSGTPVSPVQAGFRNIAHVVDVATLGIGFLWPLCDFTGQTFADRIMGTRVRRVASPQDSDGLPTTTGLQTTAPRPPAVMAERLPQ